MISTFYVILLIATNREVAMKIWGNIGTGITLLASVRKYNKRIKALHQVRDSGDFEKERELIAYNVNNWVNDIIEKFQVDFKIEGQENIPDGPCLFVANHQAYGDIPALMKVAGNHQIGFIAKDDLEKVPYISTWIRETRGLFIRRGHPKDAIKTIKEGIELLKNGFSLAIFPEGTRSKGGEMRHFKAGSFKLATKSQVPIVPVVIDGTYKIFEETGYLTKGVTVNIKVLSAIETKGMTREQMADIHNVVEDDIRENLNHLKQLDK